LAELEAGRVAATLIELNRWDAWRVAHPASPLRDSGYRSRIGFDMGFVALQGRGDLLRETDAALDALLHDGTVRTLAEQSGLTYVTPRPPGITTPITPKILAAEDQKRSATGRLLDGLDDLEPFELWVAKIERGIAVPGVAGVAVGRTECLRPRPALEGRMVRPDRVAGIQDVVLPLRAAQQMELHETRNLLQMRVAAGPNVLERRLRPQGHLEAVHGDIHAAKNPALWILRREGGAT